MHGFLDVRKRSGAFTTKFLIIRIVCLTLWALDCHIYPYLSDIRIWIYFRAVKWNMLRFGQVDSTGNVQPCVFLPVSFGNIMDEDFMDIFLRMKKAVPHVLHIPCPALSLAEEIKVRSQGGADLPLVYEKIEDEWQKMIDSCQT
jgi:hypothetical protein